IEQLLIKEGFKDNYIKKQLPKYYYLLSKILFKYSMKVKDANGYVKISSQELINNLGQTGYLKDNPWFIKKNWKNKYLYLIIREQFYDWGVIYFKTTQKSIDSKVVRYKILDEWREKGYHLVKPIIDKKLEDRFIQNNHANITYTGIYKVLNDNLNEVKIDAQSANKWLYTASIYDYKLPNKKDLYGRISERCIGIQTVSDWSLLIENAENYSWFTADLGKSGRVYSPLTSLPKLLRQFVLINGKLTVEIDIANSQPLIFCILLKQWLVRQGILNFPDDVNQYIQLCETGSFYKHIIGVVEQNGIEISDYSLFKQEFFAKIFFSTEKRSNKWRKIFDKEFPTVSACITDLKNDTNGHNLAVRLQTLEADIMIKGVAKKLIDSGLNDFYTLHDAIYVSIGHQEMVKQLIIEEFKIYGLSVTVKTKLDCFDFLLIMLMPYLFDSYIYFKGGSWKD
ncbi:MAG: hypothetical protein RL308_1062, partial [Bacteroidota bacterium]